MQLAGQGSLQILLEELALPAIPVLEVHVHPATIILRGTWDIVYRNSRGYDQESLERLNHYLRDHRTGDVRTYDPRVFDLLHDLTSALGNPDLEIDVICGYRTPWSNEFLRTHGHGVARQSLHMQAMAIDIRIPGIPTARLRDAAIALHRGGVGYYASSDFVHVDVGRVRYW